MAEAPGDAGAAGTPGATPARTGRRTRDDAANERALERLADPAPSRVGVDGARRARDVSVPSAADLAAAEQTVTIRRARKVDDRR